MHGHVGRHLSLPVPHHMQHFVCGWPAFAGVSWSAACVAAGRRGVWAVGVVGAATGQVGVAVGVVPGVLADAAACWGLRAPSELVLLCTQCGYTGCRMDEAVFLKGLVGGRCMRLGRPGAQRVALGAHCVCSRVLLGWLLTAGGLELLSCCAQLLL